jgi:hypothetical protein
MQKCIPLNKVKFTISDIRPLKKLPTLRSKMQSIKKRKVSQTWQLTSLIPATQEKEIGKIVV